jgi:hypothetical protein
MSGGSLSVALWLNAGYISKYNTYIEAIANCLILQYHWAEERTRPAIEAFLPPPPTPSSRLTPLRWFLRLRPQKPIPPLLAVLSSLEALPGFAAPRPLNFNLAVAVVAIVGRRGGGVQLGGRKLGGRELETELEMEMGGERVSLAVVEECLLSHALSMTMFVVMLCHGKAGT